ncbi:unnamed protein product [Oppiella nova]|uniref:Uncharacterized protein n=1 Tax=Oppiella nova TaxID=334625 RepID=A0A7R9M8U6_9ACAR|nr:unnamed protein product [Oppiella nova]CAG2172952.1 unnamed protein product [Oppiella nova]
MGSHCKRLGGEGRHHHSLHCKSHIPHHSLYVQSWESRVSRIDYKFHFSAEIIGNKKPNERPLLRHRRSSDEYSSITDRDLLSKQKPNERPLLRHRRSSDEYSSITDRDLLSKQYTLVNTFGGVDILGDVRQYRTGKIDTRDFGQNIHFGYKDRILPGEKERALKELQTQALKGLIRMVNQMLE